MLSTAEFIEKIDYDEYSNKQLLLIPLSVFALALVVLAAWFALTGSPVVLGVEFTGGTELRVTPPADVDNPNQYIRDAFDSNPSSIQSVPAENTYILTFRSDSGTVDELEQQATESNLEVRSSSSVSAAFGGQSQRLALMGIGGSFVGMSLIVFGLFRTFVPSVAVVASAVSDLIVPIAMMNLLGIELSLGTVAALLMLLGYSVDSDMLLNDYVIRRGGGYYESVYKAMETGITMTLTSLVAMTIMAIGGFLLGVPLLRDIGLIIAFGLVVDIMNTYLMNVTLLRWYKFKEVSK